MIARFYLGLVSLSFGATAWGMHDMVHYEAGGLKRSASREIAPVDRQRNFGTSHTYAYSAPVTPSYVPESPKTPKNKSATAEEHSKRSPMKKRDSASPRHHSAPSIRESELLQKLAEAEKVKAEQAAALKAFAQTKVLIQVGSVMLEAPLASFSPVEKSEQKS
ncbi:MAG: hypothetical protein ACHQVS_00475 [Candidatus Babeliales bacterium]